MSISRRKFMLGTGAGILAAPGLAGLATGPAGIEMPGERSNGPSLWSLEVQEIPPQAALENDRTVDLAIIGGGYTGLSCAYYAKLMRPDWKIVVLESHRIGAGASSRNSGAVYAKYVGIDDAAMAMRGLNRLRDFIDTEAIDCDFAPASTLIVHHSKSDAAAAKEQLAAGEQWITPEELREKAGTHYYAGATQSPDYFKIHPAKLVAGHANAALRLGVEIFENTPAINISSGQPALVTTPQARINAKHVCIATNAYTPRLGLLQYKMYPLHQYTFATDRLDNNTVEQLGLQRWDLRFEPRLLPVTYSLTPSGHFFLRIVLGYASHDSTEWKDIAGARALVKRMFEQRYPQIANIGLKYGWHGVTGHTNLFKPIAGPVGDGNIHISVAYNGFGIMPAHNNGYLTACKIVDKAEPDTVFLKGVGGQLPMPGDYYRSLIFKPLTRLFQPV
jgi:glycine/D-amino acid oxidase-like deaminating enzyme